MPTPALRSIESHRDQRDPDEPQGVKLLGISSPFWTQLIIAMCILATAVAAYLGREKILGVKEVTNRVRRRGLRGAQERKPQQRETPQRVPSTAFDFVDIMSTIRGRLGQLFDIALCGRAG